MTEADMTHPAAPAMHQTLAAQRGGPPIWRDLGAFGADVMLGFDGRRRVLLWARANVAAEAAIIALAPTTR